MYPGCVEALHLVCTEYSCHCGYVSSGISVSEYSLLPVFIHICIQCLAANNPRPSMEEEDLFQIVRESVFLASWEKQFFKKEWK